MAHPSFTDRSFAQIARLALSRSSWGPLSPYRETLVSRARMADVVARYGVHYGSSRAKDRRYDIHVRARSLRDTVPMGSEREVA